MIGKLRGLAYAVECSLCQVLPQSYERDLMSC